MEHISQIIKMPEQKQAESLSLPTTSQESRYDLTTIQTAIRQGNSKKASETMRLPVRYRGKSLPLSKQSAWALEEVRKGNSLFLTGIPGSGKTHLAVALLNEWFADSMVMGEEGPYPSKGYPVFLPAVELMLEIKESWKEKESEQADSEKMILDRYSRKPLLIIDDLGAEKISEWSRQVIYLLIDRRYRDCKQTIITSNMGIQGLASQLDARIASRISEMGAVLEMPKTDWRVKR